MTARDLITRALRAIGVLAQGETPTAAEAQDALLILQDMLASWATWRRTIPTVARPSFTLVPGVQDYTLGIWVATATSPQPTVSVQGTPGTTSYSYQVVATMTTGEVLAGGAVGSTTTGNATLGLVNYNALTWPAVTGAASYAVYRTLGGPTTGLIASGVTSLLLDDTGLAGDGTTAPLSAVGPPSHWERTRPVWIEGASLVDATTPATPLEEELVRLTLDEWQQVVLKDVSGDPQAYYVTLGWPYHILSFWPIPDNAQTSVLLALPEPSVWFADLTTDESLPPGYADAIRYQLAARLAPEYGRLLDPQLAQLAADSLAAIKRANWTPVELRIDPLLQGDRGAFDWRTGE